MRAAQLALQKALALAACSAAFRARASDASTADALFRKARDEVSSGQYGAACPRFAESFRLDPVVGTLLNLADCEERRAHLADALEQFRHALDVLPRNDDRRAYTEERIASLIPRVPHVRLVASTQGLSVALDGVELGPAALGVPLPVNPGSHTVVVRAHGAPDRSYVVSAEEGASLDVAIAPGEAQSAPATTASAAPLASPAFVPVPVHAGGAQRTVAWTSLAVGGSGLVLGAVAGALAVTAAVTVADHCHDHVCAQASDVSLARDGQVYTTLAIVGLGVAVVGAGIGAWLLVRASHDTSTSMTISPILGRSTAGAGFRIGF
jgi:hypothetical protein